MKLLNVFWDLRGLAKHTTYVVFPFLPIPLALRRYRGSQAL